MIPLPVEVKVHIVPYFKGPVNGKVELRWSNHGAIFIL